MALDFRCDTLGTEVAEKFRAKVKDKTFVLSGLTRGDLAATTADALAHGGAATIIFTGRSQPELQSILDHIRRKHSYTKIIFFAAETGSLASMHEVAHSIIDLEGSIDGVICFPTLQATAWELTEDGVESQFQKNYLSYFVLVTLLLEKMTPGARVVLISTTIRREAPAPHWEDINFSNGETYHSLDGYAQSMFANIMFAKGLAGRHKSISAFSVSPGNTRTNIQTYVSPEQVAAWLQLKKRAGENLPILLQQAPVSLARASSTICRALLDPILAEQTGAFLDNQEVVALPYLDFPAGEECATRLWVVSEELVSRKQTSDT
ncbi:hypothetical protein PENSTE_c013G00099 [Penicillium steckii]|uniref:Ketoreductase (KR) domain-containing protein n=1 Tax=Penicillium steckii TaxID=303698 RepID=A0A1V6T3P0_9EURO|nr:hypothetical protein PENSTE_c013G00099 [Penicillium steckii]